MGLSKKRKASFTLLDSKWARLFKVSLVYNKGNMPKLLTFLALPLLAVVVSVSFVSIVNAQTNSVVLSPEEEARIKASCVSIKSTLNQLHASDALLRVNRGQIYESMATNLMDRFNARLASNDLDNKAMLTDTSSYRTALATFRSNYISYEQRVSQALRIDCVAQPSSFYNTLQSARALRAEVHEDVQRLHQLIDDYRLSVGDFLVNYERLSD